jgi:hypothetical protein
MGVIDADRLFISGKYSQIPSRHVEQKLCIHRSAYFLIGLPTQSRWLSSI